MWPPCLPSPEQQEERYAFDFLPFQFCLFCQSQSNSALQKMPLSICRKKQMVFHSQQKYLTLFVAYLWQIYSYFPFNAEFDNAKLCNDLRWNLIRPTALEAVMKVRCSTVRLSVSPQSPLLQISILIRVSLLLPHRASISTIT